MPKEKLNGSLPLIEKVRSLFGKLAESPAETLMELNSGRKGFISTLRGKSYEELTKEEKRTAVRIVLSPFSPDDLERVSEELLAGGTVRGEDDDYFLYLLVEGEIERRREGK